MSMLAELLGVSEEEAERVREDIQGLAHDLAAENMTIDGFGLSDEERAEFDGRTNDELKREVVGLMVELAIRTARPAFIIAEGTARAAKTAARRNFEDARDRLELAGAPLH